MHKHISLQVIQKRGYNWVSGLRSEKGGGMTFHSPTVKDRAVP